MRPRPWLVVILTAPVAVSMAAGSACGSFDGEPPGATADGGVEASTADAPPVDGFVDARGADADADAAPGTVGPLCPPPAAPSCAPESCPQRTLYVPDVPSYPFGITTDTAHVYWLEQVGSDGSTDYNGKGNARVLRGDRVGANDASRANVLATGQPYAKAIALALPYLYWATFDPNASTSSLLRVKADCVAPCKAEPVATYPARISRLAAVGTTDLLALGEDGGKLVHFSLGADGSVSAGLALLSSSNFPGLAVTSTHAYVSGALTKIIGRAEVSGVSSLPSWASMSFDAGTDLGLGLLATNCTDLFGIHGSQLVRVGLGNGAISLTTTAPLSVYDLAADARYVYLASLNGYGVSALDTTTGTLKAVVQNQSMFSLAVDSVGVYWGEHGFSGGGRLVMLEK
jgi:hypothetical protein